MTRRHLFGLLVPAAFLAQMTASAQVTTATIYGTVQDSTGAVVGGAKATLLNEGTDSSRSSAADSSGEFNFAFVPVGVYTMRIEAPGFKTWESRHIELGAAQQVRKVYVLEVGELSQKVEVTAGAPLINTVNAEQQENVSAREIGELPVARRTVSNLMTLGSGVVDTGLGRFNFNGLGQSSTSFTMDGIDASGNPQAPQAQFKEGQNYIAIVSMESVQEIQISKGVFSAEYARSLGGNINVITKSGTNVWHGSAFELFNSEELNGRSQFLAIKPGSTFNQYGGSFGGPLWKDRAFLFGAYEGYQERSATAVQGVVPTASLRAAMISAVPAYKPLLDLFPLPNQPFAATAVTGNYIAPGSVSAGDNHFDVRPDIRFSNRALFTATYVHARPNLITPRIQVTDPQVFSGTTNRVNATLTYIGGPRWSSETRFGYNRNDRARNDGFYSQVDAGQAETIPGGRRMAAISALGFSISGEYNIIGRAPHKSLDQKVSATFGRHSLKFGALVYWDEFGSDNIQNPSISYQNQADLLANVPNSINMTFGRNDADGKAKEWGLFVQDDFRVSSKLTLNLGLRYDYFGHYTANAPGTSNAPPHIFNIADLTLPNFGYTTFRPVNDPYDSDGLNVGPHVGFAYNPGGRGKTVIRGGFGTMFMPLAGEILKNMVLNAVDEPFRSTFSRQDAQTLGLKYPVFNQDALRLVKGKVAAPSFPYLDPHSKAPYSMTYTLTVERMLTNTLALETAVVGTRGVNLQGQKLYNAPDRVTGLAPNPALGVNTIYYDNSDSSHYYGWQTSLRKRYAHGLLANVHYTWGKGIAYNGGDIGFNGSYLQDFFGVRSNKGPISSDVRQSFVANFVYQLPMPGAWQGNRAAHAVLGGWDVSGIFSARTGTPLSITEPSTLSGQRPDLVDPAHALVKTGLQYLNKAAFAQVPVSSVSGATVRPGTLGNGAIYGPGAWNLDASVVKTFPIVEQYKLQFRADLINSFNHTNFTGVSTNIQAATFGQLTGTAGARRIQFGLRLNF